MRPGGIYDYGSNWKNADIEGLVHFAIQEHNKKEVISIFFYPFCFNDSSWVVNQIN